MIYFKILRFIEISDFCNLTTVIIGTKVVRFTLKHTRFESLLPLTVM